MCGSLTLGQRYILYTRPGNTRGDYSPNLVELDPSQIRRVANRLGQAFYEGSRDSYRAGLYRQPAKVRSSWAHGSFQSALARSTQPCLLCDTNPRDGSGPQSDETRRSWVVGDRAKGEDTRHLHGVPD
jgi:hypothetical protein